MFDKSLIKLLYYLSLQEEPVTCSQIALSTGLSRSYVNHRVKDLIRYKGRGQHQLLKRGACISEGTAGAVYTYKLTQDGESRLEWLRINRAGTYQIAMQEYIGYESLLFQINSIEDD